jgi:hypothetical protein
VTPTTVSLATLSSRGRVALNRVDVGRAWCNDYTHVIALRANPHAQICSLWVFDYLAICLCPRQPLSDCGTCSVGQPKLLNFSDIATEFYESGAPGIALAQLDATENGFNPLTLVIASFLTHLDVIGQHCRRKQDPFCWGFFKVVGVSSKKYIPYPCYCFGGSHGGQLVDGKFLKIVALLTLILNTESSVEQALSECSTKQKHKHKIYSLWCFVQMCNRSDLV